MNGNGPVEVFGLGQCAFDRLMLVPRHAHRNEKVEGHGLTEVTGGPVATALHALARWGRRTAFAGVVGDDPAGARILDDLRSAGVDVRPTRLRPGTRSQEAFIAVEEGSGLRRITWQRPTGAPPGVDEVHVPAGALLLSDGLFAEASLAAAHGRRTVVDAGTWREGTVALMDVAEVFVASEGFARDLVGADDPRGACRVLHEHGVSVAAVTLGARGWVASHDGHAFEGAAHDPGPVLDTTGCGDVFHAGVVEGLLSGWTWEHTFDFAAWAAAGCATRLGGRAGVPAKERYAGA